MNRSLALPWPAALCLVVATGAPSAGQHKEPGNIPGSVSLDGVVVFESPTSARFIRKARDLAARGDLAAAIDVLQHLLEGRLDADPTRATDSTAPPETTAPLPPLGLDDPNSALFSNDTRLYRPIRRLCQEILAGLPEAGRTLYRALHEAEAESALQAALTNYDVEALRAVADRWFLTFAAARALNAAADSMLQAGRYRAAVQTYRTLLEVWPAADRAKISELSELHVRAKIAWCFAQMREWSKATDCIEQLANTHPGAALRLLGESIPVSELASTGWFGQPPAERLAPEERACPAGPGERLIPLWRWQFTDPDPYRKPTVTAATRWNVSDGIASGIPKHSAQQPGTSVTLLGTQVAFLDQEQLRVLETGSGRLRLESTDENRSPGPATRKARGRIPVYDWLGMRVASDDQCYFVVRNNHPAGGNEQPLFDNQLVAYDRQDLTTRWLTDARVDTRTTGSRPDSTFLAAPTVFGQHLLVPVLVQGCYALQAISCADGQPLFCTWLSAAGSDFARPPSPPVLVHLGTAYVLTNAGTVAAVDPYTGELHWLRRYERRDPFRPTPMPSPRHPDSHGVIRELNLIGFAPTELLGVDGRILCAPSDGEALLCLDGASGELLWAIEKPAGKEVKVVGHDGKFAYLLGSALTAVELRTGLRHWAVDLPDPSWSGRGVVTANQVLVPAGRSLWSLRTDGKSPWKQMLLPALAPGETMFGGPANLFVQGPYLLACFNQGIEAYADPDLLSAAADAADDPWQRASWLLQLGDLQAAIATVEPIATDVGRPVNERAAAAGRALVWARDLALAAAARNERDAAVGILDRVKPWLPDGALHVHWQLARYRLMQALHDPVAAERERAMLYQQLDGHE